MILSRLLLDTLKGLFNRDAGLNVQRIAFLVSIGLLFLTFTLSHFTNSEILADVMTGCILSFTNAFLGYTFIQRGFQYNSRMFIIFSLGGMALRFFLMLASVAAVLILLHVDVMWFVFSFMISYVIFLFVEVFYINAKVDRHKQKEVELSLVESKG